MHAIGFYIFLPCMHTAPWLLVTQAQLNKIFLLSCLSISQYLMVPAPLELPTRQNGRMRCVCVCVFPTNQLAMIFISNAGMVSIHKHAIVEYVPYNTETPNSIHVK